MKIEGVQKKMFFYLIFPSLCRSMRVQEVLWLGRLSVRLSTSAAVRGARGPRQDERLRRETLRRRLRRKTVRRRLRRWEVWRLFRLPTSKNSLQRQDPVGGNIKWGSGKYCYWYWYFHIDIDVTKEEKLQEKFSEWNNRDWTYDEWNAWRKEDGLLCRSDRQHDPEVHSNDLKSNWRSHH